MDGIGWDANQRRARLHLVAKLDGKALRGGGRTQLVGAINAGSGRTLGIETVADKSNEIPAGQTLMDRLDLDGTIVLMDAMHTQVETARAIVQEDGGDDVLVVKGNQGDLQKRACQFLPEVFPPQHQTVNKGHGRLERRGIEVKELPPVQMGFLHVAQVARIDRLRELHNGWPEVETIRIITSLTAAQGRCGPPPGMGAPILEHRKRPPLPAGCQCRGRPLSGPSSRGGHRAGPSPSRRPRRSPGLEALPTPRP